MTVFVCAWVCNYVCLCVCYECTNRYVLTSTTITMPTTITTVTPLQQPSRQPKVVKNDINFRVFFCPAGKDESVTGNCELVEEQEKATDIFEGSYTCKEAGTSESGGEGSGGETERERENTNKPRQIHRNKDAYTGMCT